MGAHRKGVFSQLYVLTEDAFCYRWSLNGIQPYGFVLYSNNRGFILDQYNLASSENRPAEYADRPIDTSLTKPLAHSFFSRSASGSDVGTAPQRIEKDGYGNVMYDINGNPMQSSVRNNFKPVDEKLDHTNWLLFNEPDSEVVKALTKSTDGKYASSASDIVNDLGVDSLKPTVYFLGYGAGAEFADKITAEDLANGYINIGENETATDSPYGQGGTFIFDLSEDEYDKLNSHTFRIELDFSEYKLKEDTNELGETSCKPYLDGNGEWIKHTGVEADKFEKCNKVILSVIVKPGLNKAVWDGLDVYGNAVPKGDYGALAKCYWEAGTAHFPMLDVEYNPNGVIIERLNKIDRETDAEFEQNKYMVYYNNESNPQPDDPTRWFYRIEDGAEYDSNNNYKPGNARYPSKIADALNALSGVSSKDGAMKYYIYTGNDNKQSDKLGIKIIGYIGNNMGYGDSTAIDMWTRYVGATDIAQVNIKVSAEKKAKLFLPGYVSFVSESEGGKLDSHLSHVRYGDTFTEAPDSLGNIIRGNTVSTGFITTLTDGNGVSGYDRVVWDLRIPLEGQAYSYTSNSGVKVDSTGKPIYFKLTDETVQTGADGEIEELMVNIADVFGKDALKDSVTLGNEGEIEEVGYDNGELELTAVSLYDADGMRMDYQLGDVNLLFENTPVHTDSSGVKKHKGAIYKLLGVGPSGSETFTGLRLKFTYHLNNTISDSTAQSVQYGMILDDIYAPSTYGSVNYFKDSENPDLNGYSTPTATPYEVTDSEEYSFPN